MAAGMARVSGAPEGAMRGRAIGAIFLSGFGAIWLLGGLLNAGLATIWGVALLVLATLALLGGAAHLLRAARGAAEMPAAAQRGFLLINLVQYAAIALVILGLVHRHQTELIPAGIALVVGLHFLPLAYLFRAPQQYVTGAVIIAAALWLRSDFVRVLLVTGAALWMTAVVQLADGWRLARQASEERQRPHP